MAEQADDESDMAVKTRLGSALLSSQGIQGRSGMDALLVEVSRTIEAYRATDPGARVDRIILAGTVGVSHPRGLAAIMTETGGGTMRGATGCAVIACIVLPLTGLRNVSDTTAVITLVRATSSQ